MLDFCMRGYTSVENLFSVPFILKRNLVGWCLSLTATDYLRMGLPLHRTAFSAEFIHVNFKIFTLSHIISKLV